MAEDTIVKSRDELDHLEAVLRMFRENWNAKGFEPIRSRRVSRWRNKGDGLKTVLTVLRLAEGPLTTHEIIQRVFARSGMDEPDAATLRRTAAPIHKMLRNRDDVAGDTGKPKRWSIVHL